MDQSDEMLFAALARAVQLRMRELSAQGLVNTAWAFATLGKWDQKLFAALARAA